MNEIIHFIIDHNPLIKYALLFIICAIEGPLITLLAGWLSFLGQLTTWMAFLVVFAGEIFADSMYYCLGHFGKERIYRWFPKMFGGARDKIEKFEKMFHRHAGKSLVITKLTHVGGIPCLIGAGMAGVSFSKFSFYNTLATFPKIAALFFAGYFFGAAAGKINHYLEYGSFIVTLLLIIFAISANFKSLFA